MSNKRLETDDLHLLPFSTCNIESADDGVRGNMRLHKSEEVLIDAEDNFREPLIEATTQALVDGYNVLIAGANGMGRTTFLIALARSIST